MTMSLVRRRMILNIDDQNENVDTEIDVEIDKENIVDEKRGESYKKRCQTNYVSDQIVLVNGLIEKMEDKQTNTSQRHETLQRW